MDFWINITTYKREQPLKRLLAQIKEYGKDYSISGLIVIDHCSYNVINGWKVLNMSHHHGRKEFFRIMNRSFNAMRDQKFKYFLNLQDDVTLEPDFFSKCIELWEGIKDSKKIVLDLRKDDRAGRSMWGLYSVDRIGKYYKSQWMDLIFMSDARFRRYAPILDYWNIDSSSGVARQMTKRFRQKGLNMYHSKDVILHHGQLPSLMNPETRKNDKLIC